MLWIFTAAVFLAAWLLFLVQPMVAKLILPLLGGSPGVWNTATLFFQTALLLGYLYAHLLSKLRRTSHQTIIHAVVLALAALLLPIGLPSGQAWTPRGDESPALWTLWLLFAAVGAPFFALASAGPLLQRWFSNADHPRASDPYFLYAASNAGSMLALVAYPFAVEPFATLTQQRLGWSLGFILLAILMLTAGTLAARRPHHLDPTTLPLRHSATPPLSWLSRLRWIVLAFIPSSLMLGTTLYLTMDIAAVPLLWVAPLAIYLLTFVLAFTAWGNLGQSLTRLAGWLVPIAALAAAILLILDKREPIAPIIAVHLGVLFTISLACHGRLAAERPHVSRLTEFYLLLAVGGVLGGLFNALLAPVLFWGLAEYPIVIVLACLLRPRDPRPAPQGELTPEWTIRLRGALDLAFPIALFLLYLGLAKGYINPAPIERAIADLLRNINLPAAAAAISGTLIWLLPAAVCLALAWHRLRFALCVAVLFIIPALRLGNANRVIATDRTFFGVLQVTARSDGTADWHSLNHGRTLHGMQYRQVPWSDEPSTYYARSGPVGDFLNALQSTRSPIRAACVGLGTGSLAAYARPNDRFTFYEIDPGVQRIAENPQLFSYIDDARERNATIDFNLGDARVTLAAAPDQTYDLIIIDAFSSDAIPAHLITREAIQLYLRKLAPGGVLAFHITNWYIDLEPVLAIAAQRLNLSARVRSHYDLSAEERRLETNGSKWAVLARNQADLGTLANPPPTKINPDWRPLKLTLPFGPEEGAQLAPPAPMLDIQHEWTDDYTDLLRVFRWR